MYKISVERPISVLMFFIGLVVLGIVSLRYMNVDLFPRMDYPMLKVIVEVEPNTPEYNEEFLMEELESALRGIGDVLGIYSITSLDHMEVYMVFSWSQDMDMEYVKVKERLLDFESTHGEIVKETRIQEYGPEEKPFMLIVFNKEDAPLVKQELYYRLSSVNGTSKVLIYGLEEESELYYPLMSFLNAGWDLDKLSSTIEDLSVAPFNVRFERFGRIYNLVIRPESLTLKDVESFLKFPLYEKENIREKVLFNGEDVVLMEVYKRYGSSPITFSQNIRQALNLYENLNYYVLVDRSELIVSSIKGLGFALLAGILLSILAVIVFLKHPVLAIPMALSLLSSVILTFPVFYFFKLDLNLLTLGGLVLVVGMLVDASIIVVESIAQERKTVISKKEAILKGTSRVSSAIVASILTNIVVFLPAVFLTGIAGRLAKPIAIVVIFSLIISMLVSFTLVPLVVFLMPEASAESSRWFLKLEDMVLKIVEYTLKKPIKTLLVFGFLLLLSVSSFLFIKVETFPPSGTRDFKLHIMLPGDLPEKEVLNYLTFVGEYADTSLVSYVGAGIPQADVYLFNLRNLSILDDLHNALEGSVIEMSEINSISEEVTLGARLEVPLKPERIFELSFDYQKLREAGISAHFLTQYIKSIFDGKRFIIGEKAYKIKGRLQSVDDVLNFPLLSQGQKYQIGDFLKISTVSKPPYILRVNGERASEVKELSEVKESFTNILVVILLAVLLVYMEVASQYESLKIPFVMFLSIPFSLLLTGPALLISGITINVMSILGLVVMIGVSINDAVVLIDYAEQERVKERKNVEDAVKIALRRRLRPILMTTFTTVFALLPLSFGIGPGGAFESPLAAVVVLGILSADIATLFLIPAIYVLIMGRK
ncbi:MAG TPA: efflux RND transporter permease subunit [Candidatus Hydrothermia bacterium]|nr:efflux RND transporter permease subunit [Candidatus Hydrothermia bacterium]